MKFINYLESISGISIYPLISLTLFVAFFVGVSIYVFKTPKSSIQAVAKIPLD
ncbi:MAG: CcoQ/FixQ family Cbb3-type cytochrome c oxidase assembly chaperone [Bacteroidetes bacterium]|nr:MAG: CcoQ/FixQ family Cbb3-type cytochrome c oxidase assembly chaperone [Bacteroidota bacterium]